MTGRRTSKFLARIQGKDEEAIDMQVDLQTTVGEMLRASGAGAEGRYTIDISPVSQSESANLSPGSSAEDVRPAKKLKREVGPSSRTDLAEDAPRLATSSTAKAGRSAVDISDELEAIPKTERGTAQPTQNLKLDPNAGCRIDLHFSDGRKIPMHILETTPIEKIARSACKALKIPLEGMTFSYKQERYQPFALASPAVYSPEGVRIKDNVWLRDVLWRNETADDWKLQAGSVITATIHKDAGATAHMGNAANSGSPENGGAIKSAVVDRGVPASEQNAQINIRVQALDGHEVYFKVRRTTTIESIGRALCEREGAPFESLRLIKDGQNMIPRYANALHGEGVTKEERAVMLIRDRESCEKTAGDWGLIDGDTIYMVLCMCGC